MKRLIPFAVVAAVLLAIVPSTATVYAGFTGGPSVRVTPNSTVEIRWIADFVGDGKVELFDNPNGTGTPVDSNVSVAPANDHTIKFGVGVLIDPDTTYYFRVTHHDPTGNIPDLMNLTRLPSFFTGTQTISSMQVVPATTSALIAWNANVVGLGRVEILSPGGVSPVSDTFNDTNHGIQLTGLEPGTTYQFRVSNRHAINGGSLAEQTGSFTTPLAAAAGFNGGPSVRVSPNVQVEIRWIARFTGDGRVELFDNPDGLGTPIDAKMSVTPATDHTIRFNVGGVVALDTTYYFRITHHDPNNNLLDLTNPTPLPSFFTGAQSISDVAVLPATNTAVISWNANVIGVGHVEIFSPGGHGPFSDSVNVTDHSIELTGLQPGTAYQYRVSNRHAIDSGSLVEKTGSFTTLPPAQPAPKTLALTPGDAVNPVGTSQTVTATVADAGGDPLPDILVRFRVQGSISTTGQCTTEADGRCSFSYQGPQLPGADLISAYADTDRDDTQDSPDEPGAEATNAWVLPASTPGQVTGGGQVRNAAGTDQIAFGFNAQSGSSGPKGNCNVVDPASNVQITCLNVTSLVVTGAGATFFGNATVNGTATTYRIDVDDLREPGAGNDAFTIRTENGYTAGGILSRGNVEIHK